MKRGQVTLFIIIGLFLLFMIAFSFYLIEISSKPPSIIQDRELGKVREFAQYCLDLAAEEVVWEFTANGYGGETGYIQYQQDMVPVYEHAPLVRDMETALEAGISTYFEDCFQQNTFAELGYTLDLGQLRLATSLLPKEIAVNMDFPIEVSRGGSKQVFERFHTSVDVALGKMLENLNIVGLAVFQYQPFDITGLCELLDHNRNTNVFVHKVGEHTLIRFIDYAPYFSDYGRSLMVSMALKNVDIRGGCHG